MGLQPVYSFVQTITEECWTPKPNSWSERRVKCSLPEVHGSAGSLRSFTAQTGGEPIERPKARKLFVCGEGGKVKCCNCREMAVRISLCLSKSADGVERQLARCEGQNGCSSGGGVISSLSNGHVPVPHSDGSSCVSMWADQVEENYSVQRVSAPHNHPVIKRL